MKSRKIKHSDQVTSLSHGGTESVYSLTKKQHEGLEFVKNLEQWKGGPDFDLRTMSTLMSWYGNPQDKISSIHVTGTNGKGSVCSFISSILAADGRSVGLTISPHLTHFSERIIIDGMPISLVLLSEMGAILKWGCEATKVTPTFHEGMTALAFLAFAELALDYQVIEVGLGGRLDSSNVLKRPEVAVITSVSLDHQDILGDSIESITREKAGIIKNGSSVVLGKLPRESREILKYVVNSNIYGVDYGAGYVGNNIVYEDKEKTFFPYQPSLNGEHQIINSAIAIRVARLLGISPKSCKRGVETAFWPARLEEIEFEDRKILIDCAHNQAGVEALTAYIKEKKFKIIFGVLQTKNWKEMVQTLSPFIISWNLLEPASDKAVKNSELASFLTEIGARLENVFQSEEDAVKYISNTSGDYLITGSIYMVGKIRPYLVQREKPYWNRG